MEAWIVAKVGNWRTLVLSEYLLFKHNSFTSLSPESGWKKWCGSSSIPYLIRNIYFLSHLLLHGRSVAHGLGLGLYSILNSSLQTLRHPSSFILVAPDTTSISDIRLTSLNLTIYLSWQDKSSSLSLNPWLQYFPFYASNMSSYGSVNHPKHPWSTS